AIAFIISAASRTVRVIGPVCESVSRPPYVGAAATRPSVGFNPKSAQQLQGVRMDPAPSVPTASGPRPAATAAAPPPLEPPGVCARLQGFRVGPNTGLSVTPFHPNSGVLVFPSMIAPASFNRSTTGASSSGMKCSNILDPQVVRTPLVATRSLMDTGT